MTVSATNIPLAARVLRRAGFTIAADGSYAACLAEAEAPDPASPPDAAAGPARAAAAGPAVESAADPSGRPGTGPAEGSPASPAGSAPPAAAGPLPGGAASASSERGPEGGPGGAPGGISRGADAPAPQARPADPGTGRWFVERWTLSGPEPYAVPLPGGQPEEPGTQVVPLSDGRVLVNRRVADRHDLALLYPTGPGTGELPVCSLAGTQVKLLPPAPVPGTAFALVREEDEDVTTIWQVHGHGSADGSPVRVMTVEGRCSGGVWLDRTGRLLALDRELDGRTKAVAADLHTAEISPLLQLTEDSDDRLLLAEPDSGLLMLRSDATGEARIGWGVLGSRHPVRFPDALNVPGALLTPLVAQPGQILSAEATVVALRAEVPGGAESLALWRPGERQLHWRATPRGWLGPTAFWLPGRELRLPYAIPDWPCGLITYDTPDPEEEDGGSVGAEGRGDSVGSRGGDAAEYSAGEGSAAGEAPGAGPAGAGAPPDAPVPGGAGPCEPRLVRDPVAPPTAPARPARRRLTVLPLQQAPLAAAQAG